MEKANLLLSDVQWPHNIIPLCFIVLSGRRGDYSHCRLQLHITITPPPCRVPRPVQSAPTLAPGGAVRPVVWCPVTGTRLGTRGHCPFLQSMARLVAGPRTVRPRQPGCEGGSLHPAAAASLHPRKNWPHSDEAGGEGERGGGIWRVERLSWEQEYKYLLFFCSELSERGGSEGSVQAGAGAATRNIIE